jgi:serine/threonine protein kinase
MRYLSVSYFLGSTTNQSEWEKISASDKSDIEILNSARLGTIDYDYESVKIIKEGGQAIVFEVKSKVDGEIYAAKRLQYQIGGKFNTSKIQGAAEREIACLRALNHPMVIRIKDVVKDEDNFPFIIMEKCKQSLGNIIKDYKTELIPEKHVLRIFTMICIPLYYIHSKKIVHRDLKPDNILQKFIGG